MIYNTNKCVEYIIKKLPLDLVKEISSYVYAINPCVDELKQRNNILKNAGVEIIYEYRKKYEYDELNIQKIFRPCKGIRTTNFIVYREYLKILTDFGIHYNTKYDLINYGLKNGLVLKKWWSKKRMVQFILKNLN